MSANLDKVIDRIRKLLALASSANENEAQAAAAAAAKLQEEYQIEAAQIELETGEGIDDDIVADAWEAEGANRSRWEDAILLGLCKLHNVKVFVTKKRTLAGKKVAVSNLFGRTSSIQTVKYTLAFLTNIGERLSREGYAAYLRNASTLGYIENGKAWGNSFRVGFGHRVHQRLCELENANRKYREQGINNGNQALVIVAKNDLAVRDAYAAYLRDGKIKLRTSSATGRVSNGNGYAAGQAAGSGVNLSGGGRGQLGAGPGLLR